jgi:hypothetical protein
MTTKTLVIKYGLPAGVSVVAYFLLFYAFGREIMLNYGVWWSSVLINLVAMGLAVKNTPGFEFKDKLRSAFAVFAVSNALFYVFYYVLFGVIDPGLVELQYKTIAGNPLFGEQLDLKELSITPGRTFFFYCRSLIGGFILSAAVAGVINR